MTIAQLRSAFPVFATTTYLNAGTCGPSPAAAAEAIAAEARAGASGGRGMAYYDHLAGLSAHVRAAWGRLLGAPAGEVALTAGASDGVARALSLVNWNAGDEILTSDEEHPGVYGPLGALQRRHGVRVSTAPFDRLADAATPATKLIVVSHVSWLRGAVAHLESAGATGVPVIVDAAQSAGAIPVDVELLRGDGVVAYAAAGQKWTCGPVGTGALWLDPEWLPDAGAASWPVYGNLAAPSEGLEALPWPDARRLDSPSLSCELLAGARSALDLLESTGWDAVATTGCALAGQLARSLLEAGHEVAARGESTLVSWRSDDPDETVLRAAAAGVVVRSFAGQPWVRASVGAWNDESDLQKLLEVLS